MPSLHLACNEPTAPVKISKLPFPCGGRWRLDGLYGFLAQHYATCNPYDFHAEAAR